MPHVDKLALVPAKGQLEAAVEKPTADGAAELLPVFVDACTDYLRRSESDGNSVFRIWHAWQRASDEGTAMPADDSPLARMVLRAPRPTTLAELAARYSELCHQADAATDETEQSGDAKAGADDADAKLLAAFRAVLVDPAGPFTVKNLDEYYPAETRTAVAALKEQQQALEKSKPTLPMALAVAERAPMNLKIHLRGSHLTLGAEVPRQFPRILAGDRQSPIGEHASGRLELANWLASPDHPLTSRVMINRIWQGHFGEGLVRSPDNFGRLGQRPDNQPLLDWLARRFVDSGWSVKAIHRLIMLSSAYRMSTAYDEHAAEIDPENRLSWRMNRRRLEAEEIRDTILAASGSLDSAGGGTLLTDKNHTYVTSTASANNVNYDVNHRSVYLPVVRSAVYDVFQAFDFADPSTMNGKRPSTTVAPQALFMMNSKLVTRQTRVLAEQLLGQAGVDDAGRLAAVYRRAYSRLPNDAEKDRALQFVADYTKKLAADAVPEAEARVRAWQALCRVVFSSNEFVYVE